MKTTGKLWWKLPVMATMGLGFLVGVYAQQAAPESDQPAGQPMAMAEQSCAWMAGGMMKVTLFGRNTDINQVLSARMSTDQMQSPPAGEGKTGMDAGTAETGMKNQAAETAQPSGPMRGAMAQRQNVLEVTRALDETGKEIPGISGWIVYYLETDKSRALSTGYRNEGLMIKGTLFPKERVLQVDTFRSAPTADQMRVTLEGHNLNLCQAVKNEGARNAACERYPQTVFHVTRMIGRGGGPAAMMEGGMGAPDLTGWFLHYVKNDQARQLMTQHLDHKVQVMGTVFPDKRLILVDSVKHIAGPEEPEAAQPGGQMSPAEQGAQPEGQNQ